jgi:cysteine desulfurase
MQMRVYLDYNSTTPVAPEVLDAMLPYLSDSYGNASSIHSSGQRARNAVEHARESVAALINAKPAEIVFTSGGTEADNLAILGAVEAARQAHPRPHIITTAIEHHAVLHACQKLAATGAEVTFVPPGRSGVVDPQKIRAALQPNTVLITVMHANNELGTIQPIAEIAEIAREAGVRDNVLLHTDAVQSAGKIPIDVKTLGVDLLSLSAHKIYGPKGVGALYVKTGTRIEPQLYGGHHERDLRPGTENVPAIVGFGRAAELARQRLSDDTAKIAELRDRFERAVTAQIPDCHINGHAATRTPNTSNITFLGAEGESLVIALDLRGVECSTGAACSSGAVEPSHVLSAIGLPADEGRSTVRFSLGRATTAAEIDFALNALTAALQHLREVSPRYSVALKP